MPRHLLTAKQIVAARDRDLVDGEGLIVRVKENSCTAVLRFTSPVSRKRRELGLGAVSRDSLQAAGETLVAARVAAEDARRLIRDGLESDRGARCQTGRSQCEGGGREERYEISSDYLAPIRPKTSANVGPSYCAWPDTTFRR